MIIDETSDDDIDDEMLLDEQKNVITTTVHNVASLSIRNSPNCDKWFIIVVPGPMVLAMNDKDSKAVITHFMAYLTGQQILVSHLSMWIARSVQYSKVSATVLFCTHLLFFMIVAGNDELRAFLLKTRMKADQRTLYAQILNEKQRLQCKIKNWPVKGPLTVCFVYQQTKLNMV